MLKRNLERDNNYKTVTIVVFFPFFFSPPNFLNNKTLFTNATTLVVAGSLGNLWRGRWTTKSFIVVHHHFLSLFRFPLYRRSAVIFECYHSLLPSLLFIITSVCYHSLLLSLLFVVIAYYFSCSLYVDGNDPRRASGGSLGGRLCPSSNWRILVVGVVRVVFSRFGTFFRQFELPIFNFGFKIKV